jgi:hypothetical protein
MNLMLPNYDAWALLGPEEQHEVGTEAGEVCARYAEPDGDEPRGYRAKPCTGKMVFSSSQPERWIQCDTCGTEADQ